MLFKKLCLPEREVLFSAQIFCFNSDARDGQWLLEGFKSLGKALQKGWEKHSYYKKTSVSMI